MSGQPEEITDNRNIPTGTKYWDSQKQTGKELFTVLKEAKAKLRFQQGTIITCKQ